MDCGVGMTDHLSSVSLLISIELIILELQM